MLETKRVINGSFGEMWLEGDYVSEAFGLQAKIEVKKEVVKRCGYGGEDTKVVGWAGKGTVKLNKISSRMGKLIGEAIKEGRDIKFTIISKLADPDAFGSERIAIKNMSFDDLTLIDWESEKPGELECPFTFSDYEYLDQI
ncbi:MULTISPECIES: phage tail tube protein [unclassified Clostridium]|uniref:phage tail tube protein n=1 Tax=unclassified Clostridium TaxID=2614128 RepID=UPI0025B9C91D|nr:MULTISPECIES: phage tail tube protein [unclassified Clostridium]